MFLLKVGELYIWFYQITTNYLGSSIENTITVNKAPIQEKISLKVSKTTNIEKTAKKLVLKTNLKSNGKSVSKKTVVFKFNGKTYNVATDKKGIAELTINKNIIKKLKKGKSYVVKILLKQQLK